MGILLKNGTIVTQNNKRNIISGDILINNDKIEIINKNIPENNHIIYDLTDLVILPGLVQAHIHLCQTIFRNLANELELMDWLEQRILPWEMAHSPDSLRVSARLGLAELLLSGTTTILDMGNGKHQEIIFQEMTASGIRGFSGMVMMDRGDHSYKYELNEILKTTESLIKSWHQSSNSRIQYALAPRFAPSCSQQLWEGVKRIAEENDLIIHSHSSENKKEWQLVKDMTGYSNIEFFLKSGLASPKLCLAHCIWVSEEEIDLIADTGINVLHCPTANLKLGSGIAPVPRFVEKGVNIALGSDGAACNNNLDIFQEMRLAALIQKPQNGVKSTSANIILDMATLGGAKALGLEDQIGSIEVGKKADLTILNLNKVHCIPADDIYSQIVYSANASNVKHVMIDGKWTVFDHQLTNLKEEDVISTVWEEVQNIFTAN